MGNLLRGARTIQARDLQRQRLVSRLHTTNAARSAAGNCASRAAARLVRHRARRPRLAAACLSLRTPHSPLRTACCRPSPRPALSSRPSPDGTSGGISPRICCRLPSAFQSEIPNPKSALENAVPPSLRPFVPLRPPSLAFSTLHSALCTLHFPPPPWYNDSCPSP